MYGWKIAKKCVSNLNCKQEVIEKQIPSEIYFLLSLSSVGLRRRFVPPVKFEGDTSIVNIAVAGKEKTAGAEWFELVGMLKEQRKPCFTVIFFSPVVIMMVRIGRVPLWQTTMEKSWNSCGISPRCYQNIVVTERSHVILPIYRENYQFWGIEGISSVHLIYVPYFFKRNVVVLPWWPDELLSRSPSLKGREGEEQEGRKYDGKGKGSQVEKRII